MGLINLRTEPGVPNAAVAATLSRMAKFYEESGGNTGTPREEAILSSARDWQFFHTDGLNDPDWIAAEHDGWWVQFGTFDHYGINYEEYLFCAPVRCFATSPMDGGYQIEWERCIMADDVDLMPKTEECFDMHCARRKEHHAYGEAGCSNG
jgi:hypothetical protein